MTLPTSADFAAVARRLAILETEAHKVNFELLRQQIADDVSRYVARMPKPQGLEGYEWRLSTRNDIQNNNIEIPGLDKAIGISTPCNLMVLSLADAQGQPAGRLGSTIAIALYPETGLISVYSPINQSGNRRWSVLAGDRFDYATSQARTQLAYMVMSAVGTQVAAIHTGMTGSADPQLRRA